MGKERECWERERADQVAMEGLLGWVLAERSALGGMPGPCRMPGSAKAEAVHLVRAGKVGGRIKDGNGDRCRGWIECR